MMRMIYLPPKNNSLAWMGYFKEGYGAFEVFNVLRDSNTALTALEVTRKMGKEQQKQISYQLDVLVKRKLICKSSKKVKFKTGWLSKLYAINNSLIKQRIDKLERERRENPYEFNQSNTLMQKILFQEQQNGV